MTHQHTQPDATPTGGASPEPLVDAMVLAAEAERFERAVLGEPLTNPIDIPQVPATQRPLRFVPAALASSVPSRALRWGGFAAAAAVVLGLTLSQVLSPAPTSAPTGTTTVQGSGTLALLAEQESAEATAPPMPSDGAARGAVRLAAYRAEPALDEWAFLDPGIASGLPTLSDERTLVLAVYEGGPDACDCVEWSVHDSASASPEVLDQALASSCAAGALGVTVFAVTGPRLMLPFHDQEARELAMCLQHAPRSCAGNDQCAAAFAGDCVPSPLLVDDAKTFQIARR